MKIENLKVNGFGKLENKEINFSNGINVIQGNNEAGKSTLLKFITSMFYGTARTKNGKNISDFEKYKPWRKEEYSGKITYTLDNNEEYEVYREFKKKSPIIYDEQKNDITKNYPIDKNKDSMFFIEQTGITEENFFASCVAEQEGVRLSSNMKNSIIQKLSNIVSSGSEYISYKKTLDKLNKRQLEEIGSSRSAGRPLNLVEEEIEKKEAEKKQIEIYKDKKYQVENEKENIKTDIQENRTILDLLRQQKINLEKTQLEKEKIKIFEQALEKEEENQEKIKKEIEELNNERQENLKTNKIGYYISILAIIVITVLAVAIKQYLILSLNAIPVIGLITTASIQNKKKKEIKRNSKKMYQEKTNLEEELEKIKKECLKKQQEIEEKKAEIFEKQKQEEKNIIKNFINKIDEETIQDILSTKYENIVEFIDEKEREQTEFKITEKTIEVDNQSIIKKLEDLVEIDEELENLYEKKDELLQLNNMYEMVKEQIEKSYQEMKENITPDFIEELKNILKKVTNGKYENIYLDNENNLLIEIEGGQYMPIDMLSSGTVDLIYLALRISAAKEISKETMPIIMDESFAYYDKERMTEILEYLSELENIQILIFTCSDREEKILEKEAIKYSKIEL